MIIYIQTACTLTTPHGRTPNEIYHHIKDGIQI
jgi:hypothetical protein